LKTVGLKSSFYIKIFYSCFVFNFKVVLVGVASWSELMVPARQASWSKILGNAKRLVRNKTGFTILLKTNNPPQSFSGFGKIQLCCSALPFPTAKEG
jgi:hypothetical protein